MNDLRALTWSNLLPVAVDPAAYDEGTSLRPGAPEHCSPDSAVRVYPDERDTGFLAPSERGGELGGWIVSFLLDLEALSLRVLQ